MQTINIAYLNVRCKFRENGFKVSAVFGDFHFQPMSYHLFIADSATIQQDTIKTLLINGLAAGDIDLQQKIAQWISIDEIGVTETLLPTKDKYLYVDVLFDSLASLQLYLSASARKSSMYTFSVAGHAYRLQSLFTAAQELQITKYRQLQQEVLQLKEQSKPSSSLFSNDFVQSLRDGLRSGGGGLLSSVKSVLQQPEVRQIVQKIAEQGTTGNKTVQKAVQKIAEQSNKTVQKAAREIVDKADAQKRQAVV
jgi:hypothetical protein